MRLLKDNCQSYNFLPEIYDMHYPTQEQVHQFYPAGSEEASQQYIFIIMEHTQTDLKKLLDIGSKTNLTQQHLKVIIYYLLCSLKFIHSANVVHRDIKPSNILINNES